MAFKYEKNYFRKNRGALPPTAIQKLKDARCPITIRLMWGGEYVDYGFGPQNLYPIQGSAQKIDNGYAREMSVAGFSKLVRSATEIAILGIEDPHDLPPACRKWFDEVKIVKYKDYKKMIQDLHEKGIVEVCPTKNILSTSGLKFRWLSEPEFSIYGSHFYEVDSLGTTLFKNLSQAVEKEWSCLKGDTQDS